MLAGHPAKAAECPSQRGGNSLAEQLAESNRILDRETREWAAGRLPGACLDWLRTNGLWLGSRDSDDTFVRN